MTTQIGLVQINWGNQWQHSEDDQNLESVSYKFLPYSTGLLQSYAESFAAAPRAYEWIPHIFDRIPVAEAADSLENAALVGFSIYIWNVELSLAIARELRRRNPATLIVFGGPQVPDRCEEFLRANPCVDLACHGEGEPIFTAILDRLETRKWDDIPGISFLSRDRSFVTHPKAGRRKELGELPSPYLTGVFEELIATHPDEKWVMAWETNRGCPFSCTFCDWGSATASRIYTFDMERLEREIQWAAGNKVGSIYCCDANFGILPRDVEIARIVVESHDRSGYPYWFAIQNAKNSTERSYQIQKLLAENMKTGGVTLSLQTTDPQTLVNIRRGNIRSESYRELQRRFVKDGIYTYTDVILGLPGESYSSFADSISQVIADGQHNHIRFHNCQVLPNAEMGDPEYSARFGTVTIPQPIRALYTPVDDVPEIEEFVPTVIETDAMPSGDWVRAKVFAWLTDLLYYNRLLQIPLLIMHARLGLSHREMIEALTEADPVACPTLAWANELLAARAREIQAGGLEFFEGGPGGPILWPGDQYLFIALVAEKRLDSFYREAVDALAGLLLEARAADEEEAVILGEAIRLNHTMLRLPFQRGETTVTLAHDVLHYYREVCRGGRPEMGESEVTYRIDRSARSWDSIDEWAEFVTWCYGRDKREHLHDAVSKDYAQVS